MNDGERRLVRRVRTALALSGFLQVLTVALVATVLVAGHHVDMPASAYLPLAYAAALFALAALATARPILATVLSSAAYGLVSVLFPQFDATRMSIPALRLCMALFLVSGIVFAARLARQRARAGPTRKMTVVLDKRTSS